MRIALPVLAICGLFLAGAASTAAPTPELSDRAAVPLHTPPLMTPVEAAATGIAPEVTVRALIDATGRLTEAKIVKIEPSTELDEHFERVTRETLLSWRYAPAVKEGRQVESRFEWIMQFVELGEQEEGGGAFNWHHLARAEQESQSYRQHILSLPLDKRAQMLAKYAEKAMKHLDAEEITKFASPRIVVYSDAPDKSTAEKVAQNLEATFYVLADLLQPWAIPYPEPYRVVVFVYSQQASFEAMKRDIRGIEWAAGFYNPLGLIAFHMEMSSDDALLSVMLHEATHAYLDRYVARPGVLLPRWLDEGLCDYIGDSRIKKKHLVPGKTRGSAIYRTPWGLTMGPSQSRLTLDGVKLAIKKGEALSLEEMVGADRQTFYGEKRRLYYAMSWLLVHFLRHGEEGWGEEKFPKLVLYVAEGYQPAEALRQFYADPADLEPLFRNYVKKF
jgi:hypothetical protein